MTTKIRWYGYDVKYIGTDTIVSTPLQQGDKGTPMKYSAKKGFGGKVVENQSFHLDFSENIVDWKIELTFQIRPKKTMSEIQNELPIKKFEYHE